MTNDVAIQPPTDLPRWNPVSYSQALDDIACLDIGETATLEFKRLFERTPGGRAKLAKALASLASFGGILIIGVEEDKKAKRACALHPVAFADEPERIMQVAASLDPPLVLPQPRLLPDQPASTQGLIVVEVPASPMAPHRTPANGYFTRGLGAAPMPDRQVEQLMRLRHDRPRNAEASVDAFARAVTVGMTSGRAKHTSRFAVAVDPDPSHHPFLLRSRLGSTARTWLGPHMDAAGKFVPDLIGLHPQLGASIATNWQPFWRHPSPYRLDGGVRFVSWPKPDEDGKASVIDIMEDGAVRLAENYLSFETNPEVVNWPDLLGAALWSLGLFRSIQQESGIATGASIAVQALGLGSKFASETYLPEEERRRRQLMGEVPEKYPAASYLASRTVTAAELGGDLLPALDWLFGLLLRNFGLPDLLYQPPTM